MTIYHPPSDSTGPVETIGIDDHLDHGPAAGFTWNDSGTKFFSGSRSSGDSPAILVHNCTDPYDLSTTGSGQIYEFDSSEIDDYRIDSLDFNDNGTQLFVLHRPDTDSVQGVVERWDLSTSYDVTSRSNQSTFQFLNARDQRGIRFSSDGSKLFVTNTSDTIVSYNLDNPWDLSKITNESYDDSMSVPGSWGAVAEVDFTPDGSRLYAAMGNEDTTNPAGFHIFDLSQPFNLSSWYNERVWDPGSEGQDVIGLDFNNKGGKVYIAAIDRSGSYSDDWVFHQYNIPSSSQIITTVAGTDFSRESEPFLTVYEDEGGDDTGGNTTSYGETYNNSDTIALSDGKTSYQLNGFNQSAGDELWAEISFEGPITAESYVEDPIEIKIDQLNPSDGELVTVYYDYQTLDPSIQIPSPVTVDTSTPLSLSLSTISPSISFGDGVSLDLPLLQYNYNIFDAGAVASGEASSSLEKDTIEFTASESARVIYAQGVITRVDNELVFDYSANDLNADATGEVTASVDGPLEIDLSTLDPSKPINGIEADTPSIDYNFNAVDIADIEVSSTSASPDGPIEFKIHQVELPISVRLNSGSDNTSIDFTAIGGYAESDLSSSGKLSHMPGNNNSKIYQYSASTKFDTSTLSYNGYSKDVSSEDANPKSVRWSYNGEKMYVAGGDTLNIYEYDSTDFDAPAATYNYSFLNISSEITSNLEDMYWRPDGKRFYLVESNNASVYAYELSKAWDISTASYVGTGGEFDISSEDASPTGLAFSSDGSKLFISGDANSNIYQYDLNTNWVISSAFYNSVSKDVSTEDTHLEGIDVNEDGNKFYLIGKDNDNLYEYDLSVDWDISSATYNSVVFDISSEDTSPESFTWNKTNSSLISGSFGKGSLNVTYDISSKDPSLEVAGEASSTPEPTTYDYKNYDITPLFTGGVTTTLDKEDINFTNQDIQVSASGEAITDVSVTSHDYSVSNVTPFIGSGDFVKPSPDEVILTALDPSISVSGEVSTSLEIVEFDYTAPDPRPVYGRGTFINPYNGEIELNALDVSGTGEGELSATPETVDYNIDYFGDAKPLIGGGDFVSTSPEIIDFSSLDPNTEFTNTTSNIDSPTIFNISALSAKPLNISGSEVLSNVPSLQFNINAADIFTEVGALINMEPTKDRLIINGPGIGVEKADRREAEGVSLQEKQEALAPDHVDVVKMGNSVYIREERVKELDGLEFILDDIDNTVLTVEENRNFRIKTDRDLRMELIEGSTLRRVRDFRKSGFNREEFSEQVAEEDLDLGG